MELKKGELSIFLQSKNCEVVSLEFEKCIKNSNDFVLLESNISKIQNFISPSFKKIEKLGNIQTDPYKNTEEVIYYEEEFIEEEFVDENTNLIPTEISIEEDSYNNENADYSSSENSILKKKNNNEEDRKNPYKISERTKEILRRAIHKPIARMGDLDLSSQKENSKNLQKTSQEPSSFEIQKVPLSKPNISEEKKYKNDDMISKELLNPVTESFTDIFNQKIEKEKNSTSKYAQLLSLQNLNSKLDCLVACAYHLIERENFERFTLKQINTLSKPLLEEAIGHETIKAALERHFIKIIPDYTGIATTLEYTITDEGVRYFEQQINS